MRTTYLLILCVLAACSSPTSAPPTYTLQVTASPAEGGSVTPTGGSYTEGHQISLQATALPGWRFDRWQGDYTSTQNPASITMTRNMSIVGVFEKRNYVLNIVIQGSGRVDEEVVTARSYPFQTVVKLTAVAANEWAFVRWEGDATGVANPLNVTISREMTITAVFQASAPSVLTGTVSNVTSTGATLTGNVTAQGGASVSSRGVCYATTQNPTTANTCVTSGSGTGTYTVNLSGLTSGMRYYARAYATSTAGTSYGSQVDFTTLAAGGTWSRDNTTAVVEVTNPVTGRVWMDRNLGASRAATSSADTHAYGDLYQWGRAADGHQKINSLTSNNLSSSNTPGHGNFILVSHSPWDWRSPQNNTFWQGENGENNPCPVGFRIPTLTEWNVERQSWSSNNSAGAFSSVLKLPVTGNRGALNGSFNSVGTHGFYWTSTTFGIDTWGHVLSGSSNYTAHYARGNGLSVRCIKQ